MNRIFNIICMDHAASCFNQIQKHLYSLNIFCEPIFVSHESELECVFSQVKFDLILYFFRRGMLLKRGQEVLAAAREKHPSIPFIFLSDSDDEVLATEALKTGATDFVLKQNTEQLVFVISRSLLEYDEKRKLCHSQFQLEKNDEHLKAIVETIPDIVYKIDPDGYFQYINSSVIQLGYKPEELIGKHFSELFYAEDVKNLSRSEVLPIFFGKDTEPGNTPKLFDERRSDERYTKKLQVRLIKKSLEENNFVTVEIYARGFYQQNENSEIQYFQGTVGVIRDISERVRLEDELRQSKKELEVLNHELENKIAEEIVKNYEKKILLMKQSQLASMGEMIRNIAHQWRQPLNALGLLIQNIRDVFETGLMTAEYINKKTDKGTCIIQHLSQTIDDFRSFFKPNKEKIDFYLEEAVRKAFSIIEGELKQDFEVCMELDPQIKVNGYPNEFSQVILNILQNAINISKERQVVKPQIKILLRQDTSNIVLEISDNGGGVDPSIVDKIFTPYFTTRSEGTGIGLYMSKMIIEKNMGGLLTFRNSENGAVFTILLN